MHAKRPGETHRVGPAPGADARRNSGMSLVEVCFIAGFISLLAVLATASVLRTMKLSVKSECARNLQLIDTAKDQFAMEYRKANGYVPATAEITPYLRHNKMLACPSGTAYTLGAIGTGCYCPFHAMRVH